MGLIQRAIFAGLAAAAALLGAHGAAQAPAPAPQPVLLSVVDGIIGPPIAHQVKGAIEEAGERGAAALILQIDTPGGLVTSMQDITQDIIASPVPVIGYVAPSGGHAASAGTYIIYATHVAAMAPGTRIGAATPVNLGPGGVAPPSEDEKNADEKAAPPDTALERKAVEDAAAMIRSLAAMRGRNAEWAERAVREGLAISETEAVELGVVELIADDIPDLIAKLDGRVIQFAGAERTLHLAGAPIERVEPGWITEAMGVLANPNVAFLLMMIGFYGLIYEFLSPGSVGPGVIGAICLVLGLYALNQLPLNYAGLALILLGVAFIVAEVFTPTFGILGIGGVIAFLVGAAMLVDTDIPEYQLSWPVILAFAVFTGGFAAIGVGYAVKSMRRKPATGAEGLIGQSAKVLDWQGGEGHVWAEGERWSAEGPPAVAPGAQVIIESVKALRLRVRPQAQQGD